MILDTEFLARLQSLRDQWQMPMIITSGYRCPEHNKAVGGSPHSQHLEGRAADIAMTSGTERWEFLRLCYQHGFTGIGIHSKYIHLDTRFANKVLFLY